ncbi:hypothetical protein, partial [Herbaspirillum sp. B65]|uniref:hypothetical protein n=1 Tax=Herbaspirillum sp. B65 TaxID=137708 RepID=UPI001C255C57
KLVPKKVGGHLPVLGWVTTRSMAWASSREHRFVTRKTGNVSLLQRLTRAVLPCEEDFPISNYQLNNSPPTLVVTAG